MSFIITNREEIVKTGLGDSAGKKEIRGLIFNVQAHSVHDGPGTRTTVFLNGCPLHCIWCSNPEGLFHKPVMMWSDARCVRCGKCIKACPHKAITIADDNKTLVHDRKYCDVCESHECMDVCLNEGRSINGRYYTISELMKIFHRDRQWWGSKGGVTFSGGEPLMQKEFMLSLLPKCKDAMIHVAIETTSFMPTEYFMKATSYIDWVFCDIKNMDPDKHKLFTGVDNSLILKNIKLLATDPEWKGFMIIRIPVIPKLNDSEKNIRETARFVKRCGLEAINILPFHRLGESKYRQLDQIYRLAGQEPPSAEKMWQVKKWIEDEDVMCFIGYETPF